jgi:hypothetical protein
VITVVKHALSGWIFSLHVSHDKHKNRYKVDDIGGASLYYLNIDDLTIGVIL